jgi:putative flippase GtrA
MSCFQDLKQTLDNLNNSKLFNFIQIKKFIFFGFLTVLINLTVFYFLTKIFDKTINLLIIYWILGVGMKFLIYKIWVFNENLFFNLKNKLSKFYYIYIIFFLLNYLLLETVRNYTNINLVATQLVYIIVCIPISYKIMNKKIFNT